MSGYQPIQVGKDKSNFKGYIRDNSGDNISVKNPNYCELTAQYWLWKNDDSDIKGLVHYRRFLSSCTFSFSHRFSVSKIINSKEIENKMKNFDVILPRKRNYFIETSYSHYIHAHKKEGIDETEKVIKDYFPEYYDSFKTVMNRKKAHMFNMMIAKKKFFDNYSEWLFDVLGKVESRIDISNWNQSESRIFGYISELLLDVWIEKNSYYKYTELKVDFIGKQFWVRKIVGFLKRKFFYKE